VVLFWIVLLGMLGGLVFYHLLPAALSGELSRWLARLVSRVTRKWKVITRYGTELGGYVHDTAMSQYIPPTAFHFATATMTQIAGAVTGTIALHRAAAAQTTIITIPVMIPSNSVALKGAYLKSIEIDYENLAAAIGTSLTPVINKVTRGADLAVAVVASLAFSQLPSLADSLIQHQHKLVLTLTTPIWIDNDEYVLVQLTMVATANSGTNDFLGAVANFTLRL
jgi:hypothetical protein